MLWCRAVILVVLNPILSILEDSDRNIFFPEIQTSKTPEALSYTLQVLSIVYSWSIIQTSGIESSACNCFSSNFAENPLKAVSYTKPTLSFKGVRTPSFLRNEWLFTKAVDWTPFFSLIINWPKITLLPENWRISADNILINDKVMQNTKTFILIIKWVLLFLNVTRRKCFV